MNKQKDIIIIFFVILNIVTGLKCTVAQENNNIFDKIVIDAGHGGNKPGALGSKYKEKDITLAVAIKLGKIINENLKSVKVYYTRVIDQDVDLYKRSTIANRINADLFLSIHCNSASNKNAGGTETYAMGLGKTESNLSVAKKENAEILTENNAIQNYEGFDINSPESDILMSLYQNAYLNNSLDFAAKIQEQYKKHVPFKNRGVHQANFVVLWKAAMPAVLTEIGFISNPEEEVFIGSEYGQWVIASCIFRAICNYRNKIDNLTDPIPDLETLIPKDVVEKERIRKENEKLLKESQANDSVNNQSAGINNKNHSSDTITKEKYDSIQNIQKSGAEIIYRIQFMSSSVKLTPNDSHFTGLDDIFTYKDNETWKYTAGMFATQAEALNYQTKVREKYNDAFVVAFHNGKRIPIVEAQRLQKK